MVKLKEFEGPLDLLLYLIKNAEVSIYDICISEITKQYLSYMSLLISLDLENVSDFIEMAASLIYIKSKTLLPVESEYDEDDDQTPRDDLIAKLLEYQKYKLASGVLEEMSDESNYIVRKNTEPMLFDMDDEEDENWQPLSIIELVSAFAEVLNKKSKKPVELEIEKMDFTVEDKIILLQSMLKEKESFNYFDVIHEEMSKTELVCTFLAILELVKLGFMVIRQHKIFGDIHIVRKMMPLDDSAVIKTDFDDTFEDEEVIT
ncbi:MAG: hypothetical protein A2015_07210 [Spirochaetes bacterium GWF1_31_7]|nr:MAG: hypothetical protein A2Y30_02590 [Spirochaetes bacterium GWE1_32_154]OHD46848.1 MAG: hypothetical protein A2Y29_09795 [Spirochaetes bacterium GWE2_31_10]OHD51276.1 MAG: hypothetical protein A2015_07210 [Spirochaetes bacterium GWF1_31_7]OHD79251.1 MAG: hypothetical protein A2355_10785 [Spirochaetes bacterium RIFOXYB1_FULL_32_8]